MPIREKSFRMGCGRYLQEEGILHTCGREILRFGHAPLILGGKTALSLTRTQIEESVKGVCDAYEIIPYTGTCNHEMAKEFAALAKEKGYDVIVGVGGGVMMDLAKLCAYYADLPVVNIPTSSATCAACTPLSVCYTPDGQTVGTQHFEKEVDAVLVDSGILSAQPIRLLLAGVFDAMAKFIEIKQRFQEDDADFPIGLDWAYVLARHSYQVLTKKTAGCIADMQAGRITHPVEEIIFASLAATGVISGIARGSNQCALAHKFYENTRTLYPVSARPYLHGEIVGVGLILQNHFNHEPRENDYLLQLMQAHHMPCAVSHLTIDPTREAMENFYEKMKNCSSIRPDHPEDLEKLRASLEYLWQM